MIKRVFCVTAGLDDLCGEDAVETNNALRSYMASDPEAAWSEAETESSEGEDDVGEGELGITQELEAEANEPSEDSSIDSEKDDGEDSGADKPARKGERRERRDHGPIPVPECEVEMPRRRGSFFCEVCFNKVLMNQEDYEKHLNSKQHGKNAETSGKHKSSLKPENSDYGERKKSKGKKVNEGKRKKGKRKAPTKKRHKIEHTSLTRSRLKRERKNSRESRNEELAGKIMNKKNFF
eukprot:GHVN01066346.1.p2 GENE.GHVN01066346.1~~GHVN01066346.1.p2  ORF type:complete len:237 (+),score=37.54 GHVN01066346.1:2664-3374(+)